MKKIFLFSVIVSCFCIVSGAFAAGDPCFEIKPGGQMESNKCFDDNIPKNWTFVDDEDHHVVCYPNGAKVWKEKDTKCDPAHAPKGSGICIDSKETENAVLYWIMSEEMVISAPDTNVDKNWSSCNTLIDSVSKNNTLLCKVKDNEKNRLLWDSCKQLKWGGETVGEFKKTSCAATECNKGWLLWTTKGRNDIPVVGEDRKVGSQGICYEKSWLERQCKDNCAKCPGDDPNKECRLKEVKVKNRGKTVDAFIGEEACVCVDKKPGGNNGGNGNTPVVVPGDSCVYHFDGDVICPDGRVVKYGGYDLVLTDEQIQGFTCEKFNEQFNNDTDKLLKLAPELCEQGQGGSSQGSSQGGGNGGGSLVSAKTTISKFFADAKSNRSVWKTAEGKFNTARLASDLTAGVVLGTVGGVVSGVVIKKKQVEKGFEALHCAVGGQTIADWGDTFTVGLK